MNLNLIYQGINYNFDLRKDINLKYVQDLASKLINKDSSTFELLYKNSFLSQYENSTPMKDIVKDDKNICIIISSKDKNKLQTIDGNKKLKRIKDLDEGRNTGNMNNLKIMLNSPILTPINSKNKSVNQDFKEIKNKKKKYLEYITENKVFEDIYNLKENEIFLLMNNLSQKIKEYDDVLYKKFKSNSKSNNQLSLYEKVIIEYKDKQISFLKKLNEYFKNENDFFSGEFQLDEFCNELNKYNNPKTIIYSNDNNINSSFNSLNDNFKNISKAKSKIKLIGNTNSKNNRNIKENKKLPLLSNNKIKNNRYFLSQTKNGSNNTINSEDSENSNFEEEKKFFQNSKYYSDNKKQKNKNVIKEYKKELLNKTENQDIKNNNNSKILKNNIINNSKNLKNSINNNIGSYNTNDNKNTIQNITTQPKIGNSLVGNNKKNLSKINLIHKSKTIQSNQRINTVGNIQKKNKIDILFETESENKNVDSSEISQNEKDLSKIGEESNYILSNTRIRKNTKERKKIGSNIYDFLI